MSEPTYRAVKDPKYSNLWVIERKTIFGWRFIEAYTPTSDDDLLTKLLAYENPRTIYSSGKQS